MHICIVGAGSVGLLLAARLAQHEQVTIVGRNIAAGTKQNVRVVGLLECQAEVNVSPYLSEADLIMVTTKATHLESVLPLLTHSRSTVAFWQNGLGINHLIKTRLPGVPLIRALSWMGVVREAPYTVRCNGFSHITLGSLQGASNLSALMTSLAKANLAIKMASNIDYAEWEKAIVNIAINGLCTITAEQNGAVLESPHLHELFLRLLRETQAVARADSYDLAVEEFVTHIIHTTATNMNSMWQDMQSSRITEIDYLNGYVMRLGEQVGLSTPYNTSVYHLVKHFERQRQVPKNN